METVFITIHDLSADARIKYCSASIEYILGYLPHEVKGKACWEYFHPDEIPFGRSIHDQSVSLDKAAVLNYCRVKHKDGSWIGCECVFTVVYDVLVASTSVYRRGAKARQRALDGAGVRRIFSSSPRDPRYHMLSYLSNKFYQEPSVQTPEPRAALFLNRFTRTSTIMYATAGVAAILDLQPSELVGKSFYYCIEETCLRDAIKCLESAKANDSIAYLRFRYRNPLQPETSAHSESMPDADESDEDDGGVRLAAGVRSGSSLSMTDRSTPRPQEETPSAAQNANGSASAAVPVAASTERPPSTGAPRTGEAVAPTPTDQSAHPDRSASDNSTDLENTAAEAVFDRPVSHRTSSSQTPQEDLTPEPLEVEAVISCSSDGLIVILRRARPLVAHTLGATEAPYYTNGLFASPWAPEPVMPANIEPTGVAPTTSFPHADISESGFMAAIRDVAVFAWSLTGINGSLADHARGHATGEAVPPGGLPVWDPNAHVDSKLNDLYNGFLGSVHRPFEGMEEPVYPKRDEDSTSSDDEILWKRTPIMPPWRRPKRRAHGDAFGADGSDGVDGENDQGGRKRVTRSQDQSSSDSGRGSGSGPGVGSASGTDST